MNYIYLYLFIILLFIFTNISSIESFQDNEHISLGAPIEHLELAYNLCSEENSKYCKKYVLHYEKLRSSFKRLKNNYCKKFPELCEKMNILQ